MDSKILNTFVPRSLTAEFPVPSEQITMFFAMGFSVESNGWQGKSRANTNRFKVRVND
jgi:hypothetical protein